MDEHTIDAEPTFEPWYHHVPLTLPPDARSPEAIALRQFSRRCRTDRIRSNIALMPSRSMFGWHDEARKAAP